MKKFLFPGLILLFLNGLVWAQPANDDCSNAYRFPDITNYCSKVAEFTLVGSTLSGYGKPGCWTSLAPDVWFSFRALSGSDVAITVIGQNSTAGGNPGGSLAGIQMALYSGVCGGTLSELGCALDANNQGVLSLYEGGLVTGKDYLIRVAGKPNATGTFQICINNFFPPAKAEQDCDRSTVLCDNNSFVNQSFSGTGLKSDEAAGSCLGEGGGLNTSESQSTWYTWISKQDCNLTFTITPLNPSDDIDFAVYELPNGIHNCSNKILWRCNATAPPCTGVTGKTGLNMTASDTVENFNCDRPEDGFSKFLPMKAGSAYALVINNFTNTGIGFSMDWGDCAFDGPDPAFAIMPSEGLKCDTDFFAVDSTQYTGGIRIREWNFGVDARPQTATGAGPHRVNYYSFGEKFITLTLETSTGCKVTEVRRINVLPCCEDLPTLSLSIDSIIDVRCYGEKNGRVVFRGLQGSPFIDPETNQNFYQFSLDGVNFIPAKELSNLAAGNYTLYIQDAKGCISSLPFTVNEPPPIIVDLGPDLTIDLGDRVQLIGTIQPNGVYNYSWTGIGINCPDCQSQDFQPLADGFIRLNVSNDKGCLGLDSVFIKVLKNYPVFFPNVISSNGDNINDFFSASGDNSLLGFDLVEIFDRWGGRVYSRKDVDVQDSKQLWDGRVGGRLVNPGVYTYLVRARFIDDKTQEYSGDLTVLR